MSPRRRARSSGRKKGTSVRVNGRDARTSTRRESVTPARARAAGPDVAALERFLVSLGIDSDRDPEYSVTAALLAELMAERTAGLRSAPPQIVPLPYQGRPDEVVGMDSIKFYGLCPHHLVPYIGEACVRIVPNERIAGAGALARAVRETALTPRLQENLTQAIADTIERDLAPFGVSVRVVGRHFCMELKGSGPSARLVTEARRGAPLPRRDGSAGRSRRR